MRKAKLSVVVDLTPEELWELFLDVKGYPEVVPFLKSVEIHDPLKKGVVWYDITSILFYPFRVRHTVDIFNEYKELGFECDLPFDGKMYQRFSLEEVNGGTKVHGEISFHLGDEAVTFLLGAFLEARLRTMLFGMFQSAQKAGNANKRRNAKKVMVSVVIPAFNEEKRIAQVLESLTSQTYTHFEVIVVDNNSTDKTAFIARSLGAKVVVEKKKGVGHARQTGFIAATGDIIASTDADTILPRSWLAKIVDHFDKDLSTTAVGGYATLYSGPKTAKFIIQHFSYAFMFFDRIVSGGWNLCGFNMAVRKDAFELCGGFDTSLQIGEDIDLSKKMRKLGTVVLAKDIRVKVSGRRYKDGYFKGVMDYVPHFLSRIVLRKPMVNSFRDVR